VTVLRHMYIFPDLDEQKVLDDARRVSKGDEWHPAETVLVHWHRKNSDHTVSATCFGIRHEQYVDGEREQQYGASGSPQRQG
jgi:hypothetical protein